MKKIIYYLLIAIIFTFIGWFTHVAYNLPRSQTNLISQVKPRPLEKYTIENLSKTEFKPSQVEIGEDGTFSFRVEGKRVTGSINIPDGEGPFPLIVMFRGYINQEIYKTGDGTRNAAKVFAEKGYMTIAPDFLGYGGSDSEAGNIFESRFQTYVTAATLLASVKNFPGWDGKNIFLWGHSNGGQIALTVLEVTGVSYPTVLWAPVSKPFPYSILYYTDESDDRGKLIRSELSQFEADYDVELYSLVNYLDRIRAPIQLNQGSIDESVPKIWSDALDKKLEELGKDITYKVYLGSDHNMRPSWDNVVTDNLNFYRSHLTP